MAHCYREKSRTTNSPEGYTGAKSLNTEGNNLANSNTVSKIFRLILADFKKIKP